MCEAFKARMVRDGFEWCKSTMKKLDNTTPYPQEKFKLADWPLCLATLNVCTLDHKTKFCNEDGSNIVLILMVTFIDNDRALSSPLVKAKSTKKKPSLKTYL